MLIGVQCLSCSLEACFLSQLLQRLASAHKNTEDGKNWARGMGGVKGWSGTF